MRNVRSVTNWQLCRCRACDIWNRPENRSRSKSASQQNANAPSTSSAVHVEPMDTDDEDILLGNIPEVVSNSLTYLVDLSLNGLRVKMEVDSGSPITIIPENTYNLISKISHTPLKPFKRIVRSASFKVMPVLGMISVMSFGKGKN